MLDGEFRYLTGNSHGIFTGTYLPDDDLTGKNRSFLSLSHFTTLSSHWYANANLNHVSDVDYFSDFGDSIANTSISLVNSNVGVYGRGKYWSASLSAEDWQIASALLEAGLSAEAVRFTHADRDASGTRLDFEPYLRAPISGSAWYVTPQIAWRYTSYSLEDSLVTTSGQKSLSRSLPVLSLDAGAYFERNYTWSGKPFVQTLEPRLYYLRVPYRDQDDIPLFDTAELTFGWNSLFRDNRFGGADRQSDANQATVALTSRILDGSDGRERLSVGVGRITYFDPPRVTLPGAPRPAEDGSAWIATADILLNDRWSLGVTQQWDPNTERTELSSVRTQYRFGKGGIVNAAYRYRQNLLEQTDLSFVIPVNDRWSVYGRWDYSLRDEQTLEALAGFEKRSCCMAIRVLGRQYIRSFNSRQNLGLYVEIELTGLGSFGRDTVRLLDNAILGYTR
jgi:LPS-assembly protein